MNKAFALFVLAAAAALPVVAKVELATAGKDGEW